MYWLKCLCTINQRYSTPKVLICIIVLIFPLLAAATTMFLLKNINLYAVTTISLIKIGMTHHTDNTSKYTKTDNEVNTNALSAIGSRILPKVVTSLYFLAYHPSMKSVVIAIKHKIPAT